MSNSLWTTLKRIGINLPISPSNPLLHPCVHDHPPQKMYSVLPETLMSFWFYLAFEQREQEKKRELIYLSRTVLLLTFTFSLISELSRGFAALPVCYGVNGLFLFVLTFFFFSNVIFRFHFVHYHSNMHACTFFFFLLDERLVIHPSIHPSIHSSPIHYTTYLPFYLIYKQDLSKMRLWLGTQMIPWPWYFLIQINLCVSSMCFHFQNFQ